MLARPAQHRPNDECRLLVETGGLIEAEGSADSLALRRQVATALGASVLLGGRLVLITDWLPGLHWRIQVSQRFADLLPTLSVDAIWFEFEPRLARWIDSPADADVFRLSPAWGECTLIPSALMWKSEPVAFALRCHWGLTLGGITASDA